MKKWYEEMFENYAYNYEKECYVHGTIGEVDFLEQELNFNKDAKILDIGCGIGRHSLELARRGYENVTGFDLSQAMLNKAMTEAKKENLKVEFLRKNALDFNFNKEFDLAMIICEGAFGLMETDEKNFRILENMTASLKDGGKFILTTLNALYPMTHSLDDFGNFESVTVDLVTLRHKCEYELTQDDGTKKMIYSDDRFFVPTEIKWYLKSLGFSKIDIFGAKLGAFSRKDKLSKEDFEMLVIAEK